MAKIFTITEGLENMGALKTGGQGSVYKARRTGEIISAVKLLPTPIYSESLNDKHYSDFQNEVGKLKKVNEEPNPNVVKILSAGITETGSFPYIEMEFIEGPDLEELLKPPHVPVFTIKETIKVAEHLAHALAHCHRRGVQHGDVKSNNVKFNRHTGNYVLLDFGLALMSDEQRRTSLRHAGAIEFMAPEQNEGRMLFQSDIYSFGVILFELLAGQVPFPLKDNGETTRNLVMIAHMEAPPPDLAALRLSNLPVEWSEKEKEQESRIPEWLLRMIAKCLEKKPENRFNTGVQLYQHIMQYSIRAADENVHQSNQIILLKQENARLQKEKEQLEQQLAPYLKSSFSGKKYTPPGRTSPGTVLIAALLTLIVTGILAYFIFRNYKQNNNKNQVSTSQTEKPKQPMGQYKVMAARAFFHNAPDPNTKRMGYMIPSNDIINALDEKNGFIYVEFTNSSGQTSKGWLKKEDLVSLEEWNQNAKLQEEAVPSEQDILNQLQKARNLMDENKVKDALYIYSYLSAKEIPEAMYQHGNLALQNKNDEIDCIKGFQLISGAAEKGYAPASRTLGFLYLFADNNEILSISNYNNCNYKKDIIKGTQYLIQAVKGGDTTARRILEDVESKRNEQYSEQ